MRTLRLADPFAVFFIAYSMAVSTTDQLKVEMLSSIERRITTCSMASLFRPTVVISARMLDSSLTSAGSPRMDCKVTGRLALVDSSKARICGAAETLQASLTSDRSRIKNLVDTVFVHASPTLCRARVSEARG
jgi:hypothetical protein